MNLKFIPRLIKTTLKLGTIQALAYTYQQNKTYCASPFFSVITHTELQQLRMKYPNLCICDRQRIEHILSVLRNPSTGTADYRQYADRLIRLLLERAVLESEKEITIQQSSTGDKYESTELRYEHTSFCIVSLVRSGSAFLTEGLKILPGARVGHIVVTQNEETGENQLIYSKLPQSLEDKQIFVVDALITSGDRAISAIKSILHHGGKEENITLISILSGERSLQTVFKQFPKCKIVTAAVDHITDTTHLLKPGIGEFGDRYFGTQQQQQ